MGQLLIFEVQKSECRPATLLLKKFAEIYNGIYANGLLSAQQAITFAKFLSL